MGNALEMRRGVADGGSEGGMVAGRGGHRGGVRAGLNVIVAAAIRTLIIDDKGRRPPRPTPVERSAL